MHIDCDRCQVRDVACDDCVVTALFGGPPSRGVEIGDGERKALGALADVGMVPPLRLVVDDEEAS